MSPEFLALIMFLVTIAALILGFPVALTLGGSALIFAFIGDYLELFNTGMLMVYPLRIFGVMKNEPLVAVPLFIFMGVMLEKSNLAGELLEAMGRMFGQLNGGLGISVLLVGAMLAASTGIVGATVVTMGLMSMPVMLRAGYSPSLASGLICSSGTLGQIIPPSIVLVLLGDILQGANEQAAELKGELVPVPVTAIDLFAGALIPGFILVGMYIAWQVFMAFFKPESCPPMSASDDGEKPDYRLLLRAVLPPLALIIIVLGSILAGIATPTESAAVGAVGASFLAWTRGSFNLDIIRAVSRETTKISSMVFIILIGASMFSLVFRGFGGDTVIEEFLTKLPGGRFSALLLVMVIMFFLGFFLDFIEIIFVVVPIVGPVLISMGYDPLWLGVMIGVNLQTSFLTPPFGFALFYLRGVAPPEVRTSQIYAGVLPFIGIQVAALALFWAVPSIVTWLPGIIFN
ncbi:MAG: TRAP transporter large permease subunit [Rhodospirillaceae bacterium]|jgi:tripartite ATP-independent transporter DctM subunit|nr:TRAP transporter large permease subunit [Rhodospirillaceae bacterium]MBT3886090.1 TRAP transporter large permease subunit [Rhodospirillaceae bacterium]MBT4115089.1 TRAP transporter large permease subunit [Rhodospirillaceae bacterium]MBT4674311.1 TRAP transporter large permease subunit [Rhodospirillaceae bacterium]MBT4721164.1 TRAP transporter large permease subunit [Rhodospirillaceae bacterium]